ncbi:hypothetical protein BASA81_001153 [Batrachochytrium salamandrivorans]|nr:hypothetical protein BASA81_001153 [Batrachochytrium salamandrivorans]
MFVTMKYSKNANIVHFSGPFSIETMNEFAEKNSKRRQAQLDCTETGRERGDLLIHDTQVPLLFRLVPNTPELDLGVMGDAAQWSEQRTRMRERKDNSGTKRRPLGRFGQMTFVFDFSFAGTGLSINTSRK